MSGLSSTLMSIHRTLSAGMEEKYSVISGVDNLQGLHHGAPSFMITSPGFVDKMVGSSPLPLITYEKGLTEGGDVFFFCILIKAKKNNVI